MIYSVKAIQERYHVSATTVRYWITTGQLQAITVNRDLGKKKVRYRITELALQNFELVRTQAPPAPRARRRRKQPADIGGFIR